ncbi:hypothetical protein SSX86_016403 [Deinandra increscens subsp. villosa]|uniref:H15 domain-containing protein n=1 Tax=Deinandra increscens subsp. villosa TaxID=3103831 RepID=A0AAP0CXX2_9ASTR
MSSTGESVKINVAVEKTAKTVKKPVTEKKAKVLKEKKQKTSKTASHPTYFQMIKEALLVLKEKGGSSPHAIAKFMEEKHKAVLPENFRKMLAVQLKNSALKGKLTKVKASYKLSDSGKKEKALAAVAGKKKPTGGKPTKSKKPAAVATATGGPKKVTKVAKKAGGPAAVKKTKKMTPAKAKQPKSIKSPAAKRVRKVIA